MAPSSENKTIVIIEQRVRALSAFDAFNKLIDSIAKLEYFSN